MKAARERPGPPACTAWSAKSLSSARGGALRRSSILHTCGILVTHVSPAVATDTARVWVNEHECVDDAVGHAKLCMNAE
jgi:hypothetical protein